MAGRKNRMQAGGWDDDDLDTDKPFNLKESKEAANGSFDKGSAKVGWFNATMNRAVFSGQGPALKNKKAASSAAPRHGTSPRSAAIRSYSPRGAPRAEPADGWTNPGPRPPRMAAADASHSPTRNRNFEEVQRVPPGSPFSVAGNRPYSPSPGGSQSTLRSRKENVDPGENVKEEPQEDMRDELQELKRDVKGLHEAFNFLKKEHNDLRAEIRMRGPAGSSAMPAGLQVESITAVKSTAKQVPAAKAIGKGPSGAPDGFAAPVPEFSAPRRDSKKVEEPPPGSFFGGILETCGLGSGPGSKNKKASMLKDAAPAPNTSVSPRLDSRSTAGPRPPAAAALMIEGGGGHSSGRFSNPAAQRGVSPHERETPMEGRGNVASGVWRPGANSTATSTEQVSVPAFGGSGPSGHPSPFLQPLSNELPPLGANKQNLGHDQVPHFGTEAKPTLGLQLPASHHGYLDTAKADSTQRQPVHRPPSVDSDSLRTTWRSPRVGQPLVLPFPEADDNDSEAYSPSLHIRSPAGFGMPTAFSPGSSGFAERASSPVPPLSNFGGAASLPPPDYPPPAGTLDFHSLGPH